MRECRERCGRSSTRLAMKCVRFGLTCGGRVRRNGLLSKIRTDRCASRGGDEEFSREADRERAGRCAPSADGRKNAGERGAADAVADAAGGIAAEAGGSRRQRRHDVCGHRGAALSAPGGMVERTGASGGSGRRGQIYPRRSLEGSDGDDAAGGCAASAAEIGRDAGQRAGRVHADVSSAAFGADARAAIPGSAWCGFEWGW